MNENHSFTILIVDDDETLRETIAFDFERKGFTVLSASNGVQALEIIRSKSVNVVISDMRMPGGSGLSLLEQIKTLHENKPKFIFLTGYISSTEAALHSSDAKILEKPFDRKVLMKTVLECLGKDTKQNAA